MARERCELVTISGMGRGSLLKSITMLYQQEEKKIKLKATGAKWSFILLKRGGQPEYTFRGPNV